MNDFEIIANVPIVEQPLAAKVGITVLDVLKTATRASIAATGQVLGDMVTSVALDITDAREGTTMRQEWIERRRAERTGQMRDLVLG